MLFQLTVLIFSKLQKQFIWVKEVPVPQLDIPHAKQMSKTSASGDEK